MRSFIYPPQFRTTAVRHPRVVTRLPRAVTACRAAVTAPPARVNRTRSPPGSRVDRARFTRAGARFTQEPRPAHAVADAVTAPPHA